MSDLSAAARALMFVPPSQREDLCAQMVREAHCADKFAKRLAKPHPDWGNGTLLAAARTRKLAPERSFSDPEYSLCVMTVLQRLSQRRAA